VAVETAQQMLEACLAVKPVDIAICAAAVADWRVAQASDGKLKKTNGSTPPALSLAENPDILATLSQAKTDRPKLVIGFAAETENTLENGTAKRTKKGCDWIVANDVSAGFGGDTNTVHLITDQGGDSWPTLSKKAVAERLASQIATHVKQNF